MRHWWLIVGILLAAALWLGDSDLLTRPRVVEGREASTTSSYQHGDTFQAGTITNELAREQLQHRSAVRLNATFVEQEGSRREQRQRATAWLQRLAAAESLGDQ
jgi:hypothetical protein